jgi:hypothetical protein
MTTSSCASRRARPERTSSAANPPRHSSSSAAAASWRAARALPLALETTYSRVENNQLAKNFGVTRDTVATILKDCGIKYYGGEGANACPSKHESKWEMSGSGNGDSKHGRRRLSLA